MNRTVPYRCLRLAEQRLQPDLRLSLQILVKIVHFVIKAPNLVEIGSIMQESISDMAPAPKLGLKQIKRMFCK